jgi:ADP-ribose pyrophosphatase
MNLDEKTLSAETCFEGKIFNVLRYRVELPDGQPAIRDVVVNPHAAAIVAVDDRGRVLMVRQFRQPAGRVMLEIPAGKLNAGEDDPLAAAHRELEEETGMVAGEMRPLVSGLVSPGFATEIIHIFLATGLRPGKANPDEDEFISLERIPLADMVDRVMTGRINDMKTNAGILAAARVLGL